MFDTYSITNSTVVEEEEEIEGKECSGVSEQYNIPGHSAPVPKCTCCTCSYLHTCDFLDTPNLHMLLFACTWCLDTPEFPFGISNVTKPRLLISQIRTWEYLNITHMQIEACANWEYPKVVHVQIAACATCALWDRCGVARYIIPFRDSQALFSSFLVHLIFMPPSSF